MADDASRTLSRTGPIAAGPRRFTRADFDRMVEIGLFGPGERVELISGEIVAMAGEGHAHADAVDDLARVLAAALSSTHEVIVRSRLDLPDESETYPDIMVCAPGMRARDRDSANVFLLIEASESRLTYDRNTKSRLYAAAGFQEYWVFEIAARRMWVYRAPSADGEWGSVTKYEGHETVSPLCSPNTAITLPLIAPD
jgi:Uma2 family endonuclease